MFLASRSQPIRTCLQQRNGHGANNSMLPQTITPTRKDSTSIGNIYDSYHYDDKWIATTHLASTQLERWSCRAIVHTPVFVKNSTILRWLATCRHSLSGRGLHRGLRTL